MSTRFILLFNLVLISNNLLFSQIKSYSDILPKRVEARPVLDSINYLPDTLKQVSIDVLNAKNFDLTKCFVDKNITVDEKEKTISIRIWDIDDLRDLKKSEKSHKLILYQSTHPAFYSGTIVYNIETKTAYFSGDQ